MGSKVAETGSTFEDTFGPAKERAVLFKVTGLATFTIVCTLFVISSVLFVHVTPKHDWRDGGSTVPFEVLTETPPDYDVLSEEQAKEMTIQHLGSIQSVRTTPFDTEENGSRLVLYHTLGHVICWEFWDSRANVTLNAQTGEMILYRNRTSSHKWDGDKTSDQIRATAIDIVDNWGGIPIDGVGPNVTLEYCSALCSCWHEWDVSWVRVKDGIETTDVIHLRFALDGTLISYFKDWHMDLSGLSTDILITRERAVRIASRHSDGWGNLSSCRLLIKEPTGRGTSSGVLSGTEPTCVWSMWYTDDDNRFTRRISVHVRTGEVVELYL